VLAYDNYILEKNQVKALACIIPVLPDLKRIHFSNNNISDEMGALLMMAAFQNPNLTEIFIEENNLKKCCSNTFRKLLNQCPDKLQKFSLRGSNNLGSHLHQFFADIPLEVEV
jgi:hypothetical protein